MKNIVKKVILLIMLLVFAIGLVYGTYKVFLWKKDNDKNRKIDEELNENVEVISKDNEVIYNINFDKLKSINSDTVAYLKVNNTNIDYVVVKTNDNKYYIKHNFYKELNEAGWIFADYHNKLDGNDKNLVIYGHNMSSGIMFGSLKKALNSDWYTNKDNKIVTLITDNETYNYEVFSIYTIKKEAYYINTVFKNDDSFNEFLKIIKSRSIYDFGVELTKEDNILTLSTCNSGGSYRTVLHARLVK